MGEREVAVDDIKHRAEEVQSLAMREVRRITASDPAKLIAVGVVGVLVVASFAYYLGSRRCPAGGLSDS